MYIYTYTYICIYVNIHTYIYLQLYIYRRLKAPSLSPVPFATEYHSAESGEPLQYTRNTYG